MGEKGNYIELLGRESDTNAGIRSTGYHDVLDKYDGLKLVGRQSANWSQTRGVSEDGNDAPGQPRHQRRDRRQRHDGARRSGGAEEAAGLSSVVVVGFDGSPDAIASIKAGEIKATVLQPAAEDRADGGGSGSQVSDDRLHRGAEKQSIDCELVTAANADQFGVCSARSRHEDAWHENAPSA